MKHPTTNTGTNTARRVGAVSSARRGGAVIVVVLTLLASLAFIGLFFYSFSDSELNVANTFADSPDQVIDPDVPLNFALQQVLVSTPAANAQSALGGGQLAGTPVSDKSILAHVIGLIRADGVPQDVRPRNGRGIGVFGTTFDANGMPVANNSSQIAFDYNGDGTADFDGTNFVYNLSAAANAGGGYGTPFERTGTPLADSRPDVDYTYPDINSPFLAYDATILVGGTPFRILIPSYFRPQLFPDQRTGGFQNIFTAPNTAAQVLRPHQQHANVDGSIRYIANIGGIPAQSGDRNRIIAPFPFTTDINGGNANEMGVFSSPTSPYEYDVDADGDGVLDSIWLDLDHPIIDLADGRQAVPLFYVKVIDADALLNLNHHGHDPLFTLASNGGSADAFGQVYSLTSGWIHASNTGASAAEVNPLPALRADPNDPAYIDPADVAAATLQHRGLYADQTVGPPPADRTNDGTPPDGFTRIQMANTELWRLLHGATVHRSDLTLANPGNAQSDIPGRYGETVVGAVPVLRNALDETVASGRFPSAGNMLLDDDGDDNNNTTTIPPGGGNEGPTAPDDNLASGIAHFDDFGGLLAPPLVLSFSVHPRDFTGLGNWPSISTYFPGSGVSYRSIASTGAVRDLAGLELSMPLNPSRWLYYGTRNAGGALVPAIWQNLDSGVALATGQPAPWSRGANPPADWLFNTSTPYDGLLNENDELVSDSHFPTQVDEPFPTSEMAALQLSDQHWQLAREFSRARALASFNFEANKQAQSIRQQFTTDSRDRLEHGHARAVGANRQWEFNDDVTDASRPRFPPAFDRAGAAGGPYTSRHETGIINAADPFRPVTRRLLTIEENNQANIGGSRDLPGQKLNLNRLLVNFDRNGNPIYRHLTPHATFQLGDNDANRYLTDGAGGVRPLNHAHVSYGQTYYDEGQALGLLDPDIPATGTYAAVPFAAITTDRFAQEAWARYDRQRMARDIFTLLYTLGGLDSDDITVNPNTHSGADTNGNGISDVVDAMAQFAVNYVDALDQDDCITRFEYDGNLSDGWSNPPSPAGIALGVETQQLTLSEVLLIQQPSATTDNSGTLHDESVPGSTEHRWLYVELRNASPFTVPLVTGSYRLARYARNEPGRTGTVAPLATSEFRTPTSNPLNYKRIGPGENFIVACHDGTVVNGSGVALPSDFYANIDGATPELESVVPENATFASGTSDDPIMAGYAPNSDLDLVVTTIPNYDELYFNTNTLGGTALVEPDITGAGAQLQFQLRLERRLNTNGFGFGENDATWVEVDQIEVEGRTFAPAGDTAGDISMAVASLSSTERGQALTDLENLNADITLRKHSMNSISPTKHIGNWVWGTVNGGDRTAPFTLWQPHFNRDFSSVYELLSLPIVGPNRLIRDIADAANGRLSGWVDSGAAIRAPFTVDGVFRFPDGDTNENKMLDPGEVANRWYRLLEFIEYLPRTHDTIRDGQALRRRTDGRINLNTLRHEAVMAGLVDDVTQLQDTSAARPALDRHDNPARNWFDQFLLARDGLDPIANLPLPGVPGSFPFRSLSYVNPQRDDLVVRSTLLRPHRPLGAALDGMQLFEARGMTDINNTTAINDDLDNVDFHTRNRLLAKIANNTTNRSHVFAIWIGYEFFEAHQPNLADPDVVQIGAKITDITGHREFVVVDMTRLEEAFVDDPNDAQPGRFDFRKFIIYRKRIK